MPDGEASDGGGDPLAIARDALSRGALFAAYDAAARAIAAGDPSEDLRQVQLLALARMGDTRRALRLFRTYGLRESADPHKRALGARLLKDRALETKSEPALRAAYKAYRDIFSASEDPYPGINAAAMAQLVGDDEEARWLATVILTHPTIDAPADYYCAATRAEALLILGRPVEAATAIQLALALPGGDVGARAGTQRQLALLADAVGIDPQDRAPLLALLKAPTSLHYCGHIFRPDPAAEWRIMRDIDAVLARRNAGFAYGSAAAGADILLIESMLARGGEVHIVLPCRKDDFVAQSVRPAGDAWIPRFEACLARAAEVVFAAEMEWVNDPALFGYSAAVAMGLTKLRAQHLGGDAFQLAVWDGQQGGPVGTGADTALWRASGGQTVTIAPGSVDRDYPRADAGAPPAQPRRLVSILMTDYASFSKLTERNVPKFNREVMGRAGAVLDRHKGQVLASNTWGDAIFAVMDGASQGARIATELQHSLAEVRSADLGLAPGQGGMRIALHYGSAYEQVDEVTGRPNFAGGEVARAARMEPITPPGAVYVTEPMAAMLALDAPDAFHCTYVGRIDLAKNYGTFPMYKLSSGDAEELNEDAEPDNDPAGESMVTNTSPALFVSHHNSKLEVAQHVETALNAKGVRCWIAPRDIEPGDQWDIAIRKAIADTDAMLLLFCSRSEQSKQVKRELILADQYNKPIIPLRLERIDPGQLTYHLADSQWIDWMEQRDVVIDRIANKAREFREVAPATSPSDSPWPVDGRTPAPPVIDLNKRGRDDRPNSLLGDPRSASPLEDRRTDPVPAQGGNRRGLFITLGLIGLAVAILIGVLIIRAASSDRAAPGDDTEITEAWFAGSWSDYRDCREPVRFARNGDFTTAADERGTWRIENGNTLIADGAGERLELEMRRVNNDQVRVLDGPRPGPAYRCD